MKKGIIILGLLGLTIFGILYLKQKKKLLPKIPT